ncbi:glutathione S-transferase [Halyomorpha halys]|uniref:glutathione S-transferase n=1 Tax=Halyomorpha halys TaxID=286706 RepID=UPI0006D4E5B3|nr:glutathione S-transferase-like [Halyomorpha halys]
MPKYKLTYFDIAGYGEPIRWMLCLLGDEFEDRRMSHEEWPKIKPTTPFGKVPILEFDGKVVAQSTAICRYLGRKAQLAGDDEWEALQIDMAVDVFHDIRQATSSARLETNEDAKKKKLEELNNETLPFFLGKLDDLVKKNNGYLANGKLSWGDVFLVALTGGLKAMTGYDIIGKHENLKRLNDTVLSLPQIKKWNDAHSKPL